MTPQVVQDVRVVLRKFRAEHGWRPGMVWDPRQGAYVYVR